MDVRKKLVELLSEKCMETCKQRKGCVCSVEECRRGKEKCCGFYADHLIASGVTVQEWISVKDRLPNKPMRCLVYTKRGEYWGYEITYYNQGFHTQYAETIYWMPLPQPPKGE